MKAKIKTFNEIQKHLMKYKIHLNLSNGKEREENHTKCIINCLYFFI